MRVLQIWISGAVLFALPAAAQNAGGVKPVAHPALPDISQRTPTPALTVRGSSFAYSDMKLRNIQAAISDIEMNVAVIPKVALARRLAIASSSCESLERDFVSRSKVTTMPDAYHASKAFRETISSLCEDLRVAYSRTQRAGLSDEHLNRIVQQTKKSLTLATRLRLGAGQENRKLAEKS